MDNMVSCTSQDGLRVTGLLPAAGGYRYSVLFARQDHEEDDHCNKKHNCLEYAQFTPALSTSTAITRSTTGQSAASSRGLNGGTTLTGVFII